MKLQEILHRGRLWGSLILRIIRSSIRSIFQFFYIQRRLYNVSFFLRVINKPTKETKMIQAPKPAITLKLQKSVFTGGNFLVDLKYCLLHALYDACHRNDRFSKTSIAKRSNSHMIKPNKIINKIK